MDALFEIVALAAFAFGIIVWRRNVTRSRKAKNWPTAEAIIQSGDYEVVGTADGIDIKLPVFAFTYHIDGQCYSGHFSLQPYITDPGPGLISRMIDRKHQIHYNITKPEEWYIVDKYIEGYRIGQKINRYLFGYPPE